MFKLSKIKTHETFVKEVKEIHNNEITVLSKYINNNTKVEVQHICGYKYSVLPCNILQGYGCPKCNTKTKKSLEDVKQLLLDRLDDTYEV